MSSIQLPSLSQFYQSFPRQHLASIVVERGVAMNWLTVVQIFHKIIKLDTPDYGNNNGFYFGINIYENAGNRGLQFSYMHVTSTKA